MSDDLQPILRELDEIERQLEAIRARVVNFIKKGPASATATESEPCYKCGAPTQLWANGIPICLACEDKRDAASKAS